MKILKIIGGFAVLGAVVFFGGTAVLAQDRDTSGPTIVPPPIVIPAIPTPGTVRNVPPPPPDADRNRMRNTVNLSERETEAAKKLAERRAEAEKRRLEVGAEIEKRQEEARLKMEKARADAQIKALERKRELESRVTQIRDEQKKRMAEQLATQFDRINKNWTDHFSNVLDQLDEVLGKIRTRAEKASANGADVSSVNAAITAAQTSIATARAAVAAQAAKTYTATAPAVTASASNTGTTTAADALVIRALRESFQTLRDQLHKDLTTLRDGSIKNAREAVQKALQPLRDIPDVDDEPEDSADDSTSQ